MLERLKKYISIPSVSGDESLLRKAIIEDIKDYSDYEIDRAGNIIVQKRGENRAAVRLMLDAHMDEVGFIITHIEESGELRFSPVGGIDPRVVFGRRVKIGDTVGVIGGKPVHLLKADEREKTVPFDEMFIDIGADSKEQAEKLVKVGSTAVFDHECIIAGNTLFARAIDDKAGVAILTEMIRRPQPYDLTFTFSTGEEVGCRGVRCAAYSVAPESAIIIESTTASDIHETADGEDACRLSNGAVVSFMDSGTVYDRGYYNAALDLGVKVQPKRAVAGGNNASVVHISKSGVRTLALSVPCRYIHSQCAAANIEDIESVYRAATEMARLIASGSLE